MKTVMIQADFDQYGWEGWRRSYAGCHKVFLMESLQFRLYTLFKNAEQIMAKIEKQSLVIPCHIPNSLA